MGDPALGARAGGRGRGRRVGLAGTGAGEDLCGNEKGLVDSNTLAGLI